MERILGDFHGATDQVLDLVLDLSLGHLHVHADGRAVLKRRQKWEPNGGAALVAELVTSLLDGLF